MSETSGTHDQAENNAKSADLSLFSQENTPAVTLAPECFQRYDFRHGQIGGQILAVQTSLIGYQ